MSASAAGSGVTSRVFLAGFPRSGTSWLGNVFNAHPDVLYRHEVIGRQGFEMGRRLYEALRTAEGLTDEQHAALIRYLLRPDPRTDRPPFFRKSFFGPLRNRAHYVSWACTSIAAPLRPLFSVLYRPALARQMTLVIKETRSDAQMRSILLGYRADLLVLIVRDPMAVVGSHMRGIRMGLMAEPTPEQRTTWLGWHRNAVPVRALGLGEAEVHAMSVEEFIALRWRVYAESMEPLLQLSGRGLLLRYEEAVTKPVETASHLLAAANLDADEEVIAFCTGSQRGSMVNRPLVRRDASSKFYSVYRPEGFSTNVSSAEVSTVRREQVLRILDGMYLDGEPITKLYGT